MGHAIAALLGALSLVAIPAKPGSPKPVPAAEPQFLFNIATSGGASESTWASLAYDRKHDELFVVTGGLVRVFNAAAMESYTLGGDGDLGSAERLALLENGDILLLTSVGGRRAIVRCDFRGERLGSFEVKSLPAAFAGFEADRIQVQGDKVFLVQMGLMRVVVTDFLGQVERAFDLARLVLEKDPTIKTGMNGFWADPQGNFVFTMPYAFTAFVMSPSGELRQFGTRGSAPGKFNIVGSVAADEQGNLFILDRLRSVVMVFDPKLRFVLEFGYRGDGPSNLIAPYDVVVGNGKVFVSQARDRGVKVFHYQAPIGAASPAGAAGG
jgi:hypothetical protein